MAPRPEGVPEVEAGTCRERPKVDLAHPLPGEDVVISGISGSFPDSDGMDMFRDKLMNKVDLVCGDDRRWKIDHPEIPQRSGKIYNVQKFDAGFFGVHANQADVMDPMLRVALERVYEAIVDAGVSPSELRGSDTGVFAAVCFCESDNTWFYDNIETDGLAVTDSFRSSIPHRISQWLGLSGPSCVFDTACSSSTYAFEKAYCCIRAGECDSALVVGLNLCLHPFVSMQFFKLGVLSAEGMCKTFDNAANGYVRAEAVVAIYMQKSKDSKRIYARVVHAKTNCDGYKETGITFPSADMQKQLLTDFYQECKVDPTTVSYVEAHGTGTQVGDPEECNVIDEVFCSGRKEPLLIGSVKSNMGHSEPSSALCSVAKAIIALETGIIPPNLHYKTPRESIRGLVEGRMKVVTEPTPLPGDKGLISISSFGFGGANGHILLERNHKNKVRNGSPSDNIPRLVTVSGRTTEAVQVILDDVMSRPLDEEFVSLLHVIHAKDIPGHNYRGFAVLTTKGEHVNEITAIYRDKLPKNVILVFPGLGGLTAEMGKSLLKLPAFAKSIERSQAALGFSKVDLLSIITEDDVLLDDPVSAIVGVVAVQIGLVDCLSAVGVVPDVVLGYSIGELACAYSVGNLTAHQAIQAAYCISRVITQTEVDKTLTVTVGLGAEELATFLSPEIKVCGLNGPSSSSVVGPVNSVHRLKQLLLSRGVTVEDKNLSGIGLHSSYIAKVERQLISDLGKVIPSPLSRSNKWISTGKDITGVGTLCSAQYFTGSLLSPVLLRDAMAKLPKSAVMVEVGPPTFLKSQLNMFSSPYINLIDNREATTEFIGSLGRLYLHGVNIIVTGLCPPVKWPVSRGTRMISPLVRWDHSKDHFVSRFSFKNSAKGAGGETRVVVSLKSEEDGAFLQGHTIDGRVLYPATGYINLVAAVVKGNIDEIAKDNTLVFEDIQFLRATPLNNEGNQEFLISIQHTSGRFEIMEGGAVIVTGFVKICDGEAPAADPSVLQHREQCEGAILQKKDIYKELRLRGYNYSGLFRGLESANSAGTTGVVSWNDNMVAFMDTMLQIQMLGWDSRDLYVPTAIAKLVINPLEHFRALEKTKDGQTGIPINYYKDVNIIKAGGVEIWNLRAQQIPRRKTLADPVLERYAFAPYTVQFKNQNEGDIAKVACWMIHLALENLRGIKVRVLEFAKDMLFDDSPLLAPHVATILGNLPLIQAEVRLLADSDSPFTSDSFVGVTVSSDALDTEADFAVIIGPSLLDNTDVLNKSLRALKDGGFLLSRERVGTVLPDSDLVPLTEYTVGQERYILLRKSKNKGTSTAVVSVTSGTYFSWINPLKKALLSDASRVILLAENERTSGILGLANCLLQEPAGEKIRCVYIRDNTAPAFDLNLPLYADQLAKDLVMNVYEDGVWGSYRHQTLENLPLVPAHHIYLNNAVRGDLSSLTLYQGPLDRAMKTGDINKKCHVKVHYAAINFRDVLLTSGKIVLPASISKGNELQIGFEFSGVTDKGERVMGVLPRGAMTSVIETDPLSTWKIPDDMSLEDAATVPIVYLTVYRALVVNGKARRGESVLIHSAAGGIGIAAINVALALGLKIFVTVGTPEKREFLRKNYPQIPESHIGNSRNTSFEEMVKRETKLRGVDMVLNSLSEDKMAASLRCLAPRGRFLEIGKYDLLNNAPIGMEPFLKNASYHCIMLDLALEGSGQNILMNDMTSLLRLGVMKPLPRTVFDISQSEQAFRYMTTGKHMGKVLMRLRGEEESTKDHKIYNAVPRYFCNTESSYIVIGGLGGFGLELANWLVTRGARTLILTSRAGIRNGYQSSRVHLWRRHGVKVEIATQDISTEEGVSQLLTEANTLAPVAAIFNLAVVLEDSIFENQTEDSFRKSFSGKAIATSLLDKVSRRLCPSLEEFVVFSSVSCGRGNAGQTNYGMSNSVMERICEQRKAEGLPALAVQWGAIGEVGLVAEMAESHQELVIGGTLQQTISSCLQCMDTFLSQEAPVVASMVVAEKRSLRKDNANIADTICSILGIRDQKCVSMNSSLTELGMDSMTAVEIKQTLEREFEVFLSAQELRGMTFGKLAALGSSSTAVSNVSNHPPAEAVDLSLLIQNVPPESETLVMIKSLKTASVTGDSVFFIPGLDGFISSFIPLAQDLDRPAFALSYPHQRPDVDSVAKTALVMLPALEEQLGDGKDFTLVGYSAGSVVAIELASLLEASGRKGRLILIDGSPALVASLLKAFDLSGSDADIENLVLIAVQESLVPGDLDKLQYFQMKTWEEKCEYLESKIGRSGVHRKEYLVQMVLDVVLRLKNLKYYERSTQQRLASKITLIKPRLPTVSDLTDDQSLSVVSEEPVEVITVEGNHITMLSSSEMSITLKNIVK